MTLQEKISIGMNLITIIGIIFGVYLYFRKPQEQSEMTDIGFDKDLKHLKEDTEKRFTEMVNGFNKSIELALNHSHTVESKLDAHIKESQAKGECDARWQGRMETLLEERLPRK